MATAISRNEGTQLLGMDMERFKGNVGQLYMQSTHACPNCSLAYVTAVLWMETNRISAFLTEVYKCAYKCAMLLIHWQLQGL